MNYKSFDKAILLPQYGYFAQNAQKWPKNAPIFGKTCPEGPDLDKFVDFLDILSIWASMSPVSGKQLTKSEKSSLVSSPCVSASSFRDMGHGGVSCISKEKGAKKTPMALFREGLCRDMGYCYFTTKRRLKRRVARGILGSKE